MTSPQSAVPPGQFCGSDPSYQQSQAQAQAQISAQLFNNRMRCWINNSTINPSLISTISNNFFLITKSSNNHRQSHLQYNRHHQHQHQMHLNHRPLRCPHQVQQRHHSIPLRCCNKWRRPSKTFENSLAAVVEKSQERPPHHIPHPPPPSIPAPSHSSHHRHLSPPPLPQSSHHSRRSRSIRRRSASPEIDNRPRLAAVLDDAGYHFVIVGNPHGTSHLHVIVIDLKIDGTVADLSRWSRHPLSVVPNTTNKIRTDLSTLTTCLPVHLNHANHQVGNNLPLRKITIIEDIVNKIHHNGKTGTTGANGRPPPVTTNPPGHTEIQTTLNLQSTSTLPLGQHSLPLTPSRSPPLCGSSLQASNRLLRFRSATSLVQKTASQVRHRRPLPGSVVIAGWPHADLSSWWQQNRVDKMGQVRPGPPWADEGCIRTPGRRTTKCQHWHRAISRRSEFPSSCRSQNPGGNCQAGNQLDLQCPIAPRIWTL